MKSPGLIAILTCCALLAPQAHHLSVSDRLAAAIRSGTPEDVDAQLQRGADPDWRLANGETPLAFSILKERYQNADLLLAHGANPRLADHGMSMLSLIVQARTCPAATVSALLAAGADPNLRDSVSSRTPLLSALRSGAQACAEELIAHGASIEATDAAGGTALDAAVMGSSPTMVELLIARGLAANPPRTRNATPLMWAALRPNDRSDTPKAIIAVLLTHRADPCVKDVRGMSAADYAQRMGFAARASHLAGACVAWRSEHPLNRPHLGPSPDSRARSGSAPHA